MSNTTQQLKKPVTRLLRHMSYQADYAILRPSNIAISMTNRCNSKCLTCSYWKNCSTERELSTPEWKEIITKIRNWYGFFHFAIGGGEPLMRKDLCDVINHAVNIGSHPSVITNGLLLSKERILALLDAGLREIVLSLNGIKPETHDFTRGVPGSFNQIMKAIDELRQLNGNTVIGIATVLMGYNIDEAVDLVRWAKENALSRITFQALFFETGNKAYEENWHEDSVLWPSKNGSYSEVIDELIRLKEAGYPIANPTEQLEHFKAYFLNPNREIPITCKIGIHGFFVEPTGEVKLCYLFDPMGDLLKDSPKDIWNSKKAREIRKLIKKCKLNCRLKNCNYRE